MYALRRFIAFSLRLINDLLQGRLLPAVNTTGSQCSLLALAGIFLATLQVSAALLPTGQHYDLTLLILGWLTVAGWQALVASGAFLCATLIQALIILNHPSYNFQAWHATLIFWAVLVVAVLVNTVVSSVLPKIEGLILILHILGFFAVLIPLVYMSPSKGSAKDVFTLFLNQGGWSSQGLSFFIGLMGSVFSFLGIFFPLPTLSLFWLIYKSKVATASFMCVTKISQSEPLLWFQRSY